MTPLRMSFVVPGAPVPKARARVSVRKNAAGETKVRAHTPKRTAQYESLVGMTARVSRPSGWPMNCVYKVSFDAVVAEDRADIDNYLKSLLDGAQGVLWTNDKSVRQLGECSVVVGPKPCVVVRVEAMSVKCSRDACAEMTFYPDADGRCTSCPVQRRRRAA